MPFKLVMTEGGFKVRDDKGKFYSKKPMSRRAAVAQMRALYASEVAAKSKMGDLDALRRNEDIRPFAVFKDAGGNYRWILISSNAYRDRDREIVSTKALENDVALSDEIGVYGPLRWWHVDGMDIGDCDWRILHGKTLIESGTFRSKALAERTKELADSLQVSLGFRHPQTEPDRDGVYHNIRVFERSLLPRLKAANPFTRVFVSQEDDMATKAEKLAEFEKKYGIKPDEILKAAEAVEKELDDLNIAFKQADEGGEDESEKAKKAPPKPEPEPEEDDIEGAEVHVPDEEDEEEKEDEEPVIGNMSIKEFKAFLAEALAPIAEKMHSHDAAKEAQDAAQAATDLVQAEKQARETALSQAALQIKAMTEQITLLNNKVKELSAETPRAFAGYRASEDPDTVIDAKEVGGPQADNFLAQFIGNLTGTK